jgi:hypothetical protein
MAAKAGAWRFRFGPQPQTILSVGLLMEGARIILDHARRFLRSHPLLEEGVEERADGFVIPATGSRWIIRSRDHESSRGEHPDLVTYDECGWAKDDELFASLLAAQASVLDPLMLVVSTVGRRKSGPLWRLKELGEAGEPGVFWYYTSENGSPRITAAFLERQKRLLMPAQYAREHQNTWVDQADSFTVQPDVDAAMSTGWVERLRGAGESHKLAGDIGYLHDPAVIGSGHRGADGRIYVDRLINGAGKPRAPGADGDGGAGDPGAGGSVSSRGQDPNRILARHRRGAVAPAARLAGGVVHADGQESRRGVADVGPGARDADAGAAAARAVARGVVEPRVRGGADGGAGRGPWADSPGPRGGRQDASGSAGGAMATVVGRAHQRRRPGIRESRAIGGAGR